MTITIDSKPKVIPLELGGSTFLVNASSSNIEVYGNGSHTTGIKAGAGTTDLGKKYTALEFVKEYADELGVDRNKVNASEADKLIRGDLEELLINAQTSGVKPIAFDGAAAKFNGDKAILTYALLETLGGPDERELDRGITYDVSYQQGKGHASKSFGFKRTGDLVELTGSADADLAQAFLTGQITNQQVDSQKNYNVRPDGSFDITKYYKNAPVAISVEPEIEDAKTGNKTGKRKFTLEFGDDSVEGILEIDHTAAVAGGASASTKLKLVNAKKNALQYGALNEGIATLLSQFDAEMPDVRAKVSKEENQDLYKAIQTVTPQSHYGLVVVADNKNAKRRAYYVSDGELYVGEVAVNTTGLGQTVQGNIVNAMPVSDYIEDKATSKADQAVLMTEMEAEIKGSKAVSAGRALVDNSLKGKTNTDKVKVNYLSAEDLGVSGVEYLPASDARSRVSQPVQVNVKNEIHVPGGATHAGPPVIPQAPQAPEAPVQTRTEQSGVTPNNVRNQGGQQPNGLFGGLESKLAGVPFGGNLLTGALMFGALKMGNADTMTAAIAAVAAGLFGPKAASFVIKPGQYHAADQMIAADQSRQVTA